LDACGGTADAADAPTPATVIAPTAAIAASRFLMSAPSFWFANEEVFPIGTRANQDALVRQARITSKPTRIEDPT